jgi:hypothetical protein
MNLATNGNYERVYEVTNNNIVDPDHFAKAHKGKTGDDPIAVPDQSGATPGTWYEEGKYSFKNKVLTMSPEKRVKIADAGGTPVGDLNLETLLADIAKLKEALATVLSALEKITGESYTAEINDSGELEVDPDAPGAGAPMKPPFNVNENFNEDIYNDGTEYKNGKFYQFTQYADSNPNDPRNITGNLPSQYKILNVNYIETIVDAPTSWAWTRGEEFTHLSNLYVMRKVSENKFRVYELYHGDNPDIDSQGNIINWQYEINGNTVLFDTEGLSHRIQITDEIVPVGSSTFELKVTVTYKGITGVIDWTRFTIIDNL